jgi:DNA (cytosine-5)-methyltransferase 1
VGRSRPRLLDLYCCAGGSAAGYAAAGFDVTGVDVIAHERYPYPFALADAVEFVKAHGHEFDAIHASPPCQAYSAARVFHPGRDHPDLIGPTRDALIASGRPWVIENVVGAPLINPVMLCGSMFGLAAVCRDGRRRGLRRHRRCEVSRGVELWPPYSCDHALPALSVYGHGGGSRPVFDTRIRGASYTAPAADAAAALGIGWMSRDELAQAIPPAYTAHVGAALAAALAAANVSNG